MTEKNPTISLSVLSLTFPLFVNNIYFLFQNFATRTNVFDDLKIIFLKHLCRILLIWFICTSLTATSIANEE